MGIARAHAQQSSATLAQVEVLAPTPGRGPGGDDAGTAAVVLGTGDIERTGVADFTGALLTNSPSATINDVEGNPFQPDILFRGFTASPVAGTAEGLAVYVDGARFNEPFGDTVNWDLIPPSATQSAVVETADPLLGLNALGGAINVLLKDGFSDPGAELTLHGGSFGRRAASLELGRRIGAWGLYLATDITHDDGFRQTSASDLKRLYADLGWRGAVGEFHLGVSLAHDTLGNPGATPVQALDAGISNIFTAPNSVDNRYAAATLRASLPLGDGASLQATAYGQTLTQLTPNGTTVEVEPCDDGSGLLCNDDGTVITGTGGAPIADFLHGGPYSGLSTQYLTSHAYGAAVEVTDRFTVAGHASRIVAGMAYDGSDSVFAGTQAIGGFDPFTREFLGPGVIIDDPSEAINPVQVLSVSRALGVYATDLLSLTPRLDLDLAGRFEDIRIGLEDQLGGPVSGLHEYGRFDPSVRLTWRLVDRAAVYAAYAEANRAPTPQELSCASAATPCGLLSFFVGDPDLRQVVARTVELGARGVSPAPFRGRWRWTLDYFRTSNTNDILYESLASNPNLAFFTNAGVTLRQGVEASLRYAGRRFDASLGYAYVAATFRTPLLLDAGANPAADAAGQVQVEPGDSIPGIPRHRVTLVLDWTPDSRWTLGATATAQSAAWRFGDPSNAGKPVAGYARLDLNLAFHVNHRITVFGILDNALDTRYDTYGSFAPVADAPWPNIPGGVTDPRTASPGAPIAIYGGFRLGF